MYIFINILSTIYTNKYYLYVYKKLNYNRNLMHMIILPRCYCHICIKVLLIILEIII